MTQDWARLGTLLKQAREGRGLQQKFVAKSLKVERGAIYNIEKGAIKKLTGTIHHYAELVGWNPESLGVVLEGGEPETAGDADRASGSGRRADTAGSVADHNTGGLSLLVRKAMYEGELIDSDVESVRTPNGEIRVAIVARGVPGASGAQLDEAGEVWARLRTAINRAFDEEQGGAGG
ncbi:RodZ family helix-turn-helix domain-containing protein [Streptomyces sp. NBRC 109706]|uniref:helix-turn-helix domain-containing protein n=1 Tax=Streptomyces sp. NBRC 109706 TaxID=1550035 RepID=UPI000AC716DA|nr:helix-turn-helix transcriptional regulator [Streptomyces sp. NBRC 109706]